MTLKRVGFACKYMHHDLSLKKGELKAIEGRFSAKTTTIKWLNAQSKAIAEERLWAIIEHNTQALRHLICYVGKLAPTQRMVRLSSDQLPGFTHPDTQFFWQEQAVKAFLEKEFAQIGTLARQLDVRLSMHPSQFVVLASENRDTVEKSRQEIEYHANLIRWMGYGQTFQDFKCNVHISGKKGPEGIKAILPKLSSEARNTLTIENDELSWGIEASLALAQDVALVLDIHHHWIKDEEYIYPNDTRVQRIIESWRGVRPVIHYSVSPESVLVNHATDTLPDIKQLLKAGFKKSQLRRHSDFMWNKASNAWAGLFRDDFDIMVEAKAKNQASIPFEEATR